MQLSGILVMVYTRALHLNQFIQVWIFGCGKMYSGVQTLEKKLVLITIIILVRLIRVLSGKLKYQRLIKRVIG